jgi:subtilisin family serine protease
MFDAVKSGKAAPEPPGTEIAGILVARAKLTGVAPEAKLLSVRAFSGGKAKPAQSTSLQLLKGINWAFDAGARIMNMSFAGPMDPLLERIIKAAAEKGVILVAAAGNEGPKAPPVYPAAYPDVIAVTATDEKDKLYAKANRGDYISVAAPGVDIIAPGLKGSYALSSGTSMAAAHVSGVAALLLERNAELSAADARGNQTSRWASRRSAPASSMRRARLLIATRSRQVRIARPNPPFLRALDAFWAKILACNVAPRVPHCLCRIGGSVLEPSSKSKRDPR